MFKFGMTVLEIYILFSRELQGVQSANHVWRKERGEADQPIYTIKITAPKHGLYYFVKLPEIFFLQRD